MKKAMSTINIIIALILILIIVFVLVWKLKDSFFNVDQTYSCSQQGGTCTQSDCDGQVANLDCPKEYICCLPIG